ncbi:PAP2 superfamily protein [Minicystis rosea]|nr:PAP2 superfamily protein [Minicystis rosea]
MRSLWPRFTLLPLLPFVPFCLFVAIQGDLRWEHVVIGLGGPALAYGTVKTKRLFMASYPMMLVGILYDAMGYVKNVGVSPERVHDCDLRALELRLFGITLGGQRFTLNDYFFVHHWTWVDVYCAIPYGTFIFACLAAAVILYFKDYRATQRFAWIFFLMNVMAFITYHVLPAAPPWYYHEHGCEISMTALPSAGPRLLHVDEVLGITYFRGMYARSSDLYGALPSLHVAYPLLIVLEGFRSFGRVGRALSISFAVSMAFSAVYLDHHWVIDVLLGVTYCLISTAFVRFAQARLEARPAVAASRGA